MLAIVGPTAVGKTDAAVAIACRHGGEIISADSMAVYRGTDIGTAKPTPEQRRRVRFHGIDVVEPDRMFSAAEFCVIADKALQECRERGALPLVVGGTGLYVRAFLDRLSLAGVPADPLVRQRLREEAERAGLKTLYDRLAGIDPIATSRIHPNDAVRIIRALEIWMCTGQRPSDLYQQDRSVRQPIEAVYVGLTMPRETLDMRIDRRVDRMFEQGLVEETAGLLRKGLSPKAPALRALGYREVVAYLRGMMTLDDCIRMVKKNTRRYARRQMTWFRADDRILWLDVTGVKPDRCADRVMEVYAEASRRT